MAEAAPLLPSRDDIDPYGGHEVLVVPQEETRRPPRAPARGTPGDGPSPQPQRRETTNSSLAPVNSLRGSKSNTYTKHDTPFTHLRIAVCS